MDYQHTLLLVKYLVTTFFVYKFVNFIVVFLFIIYNLLAQLGTAFIQALQNSNIPTPFILDASIDHTLNHFSPQDAVIECLTECVAAVAYSIQEYLPI
jgi:hypothetical protein